MLSLFSLLRLCLLWSAEESFRMMGFLIGLGRTYSDSPEVRHVSGLSGNVKT